MRAGPLCSWRHLAAGISVALLVSMADPARYMARCNLRLPLTMHHHMLWHLPSTSPDAAPIHQLTSRHMPRVPPTHHAALLHAGGLKGDAELDLPAAPATRANALLSAQEKWEVALGSLLCAVRKGAAREIACGLGRVRLDMMSVLPAISQESYERAYPYLVKLHMLQVGCCWLLGAIAWRCRCHELQVS